MTELATRPDNPLEPVPAPQGSWLARNRYWVLAAVVVVLVASQTRNQQWTTDMWIHAASVREFLHRPFDPGDPVLSAVHDFPLMSPYAWTVGQLARFVGDDPLVALSVMAVVNVALVLVAFRSFVIELTDNRRAPFYALLAALLLWGPRAWRWSGVIHLDSIGYVAPFPSMFALAVFLFVLTQASRFTRMPEMPAGWWRLVVVGVGTGLVLLSHPPTAVVLAVTGPVLVLCRLRPLALRPLLWLLLAVAVGVGVAATWPFFGVFDLAPSSSFQASDDLFYEGVVLRVLPAVLGLYIVVRRSRADWRDPLGLLVAACLALYLVGIATGVSRSIIFGVLLLQIAVGDGLGRIEVRRREGALSRTQWTYVGACAALALAGLVFLRAGPARMIPEELRPGGLASSDELTKVSDSYESLEFIGQDDVVLASYTPSIYLPAFTGKLVASDWWHNPLAEADERTRRRVSKEFLDEATPDWRRVQIIEEYGAQWIVVSQKDDESGIGRRLAAIGATEVYRGDDLIVFRVADSVVAG